MPRAWHAGHAPFASVGADTFLAVSSSQNALWTCEPEAILQISKSKNRFPKAVKALGLLNVYGPTVTATDGEESRTYRGVVGPAFNERTYALLWAETLELTGTLIGEWTGERGRGLVEMLGADAAKMTLHIMSRVCFGRKMPWVGELDGKEKEVGVKGHEGMSYSEALKEMLENVKVIFLFPAWFLSECPCYREG